MLVLRIVVSIFLIVAVVNGFSMKFNPLVNIKGSKSLSVSPVHENGNSIATSSWDDNKNRDIQRKFIKPCIATVLMFSCLLSTSHAQDGKDGTKTSKAFESCMSKCIYAETRTPPAGSKSERLEPLPRSEIVVTCREKCAKTKEQTLIGSPKKQKLDIERETINK